MVKYSFLGFIYMVGTLHGNLVHLRQYPVRFGFKIVDLYSDLVSSALGKTPVPKVTPKATESYEGMPDEIGALDYAQVINVFNYLRQGKDLIIPKSMVAFGSKAFALTVKPE